MKKRFLFTLVFLLFSFQSFAQFEVKVDERFELTSIAFRLAEAKEYVNNQLKQYAEDTDKYFSDYKEHELIQYIKELRKTQKIAYDAVSSSAVLLIIENGRVKINPKADLEYYVKEKDDRWTLESLNKYVELLNKFYRKSKFKKFFDSNQSFYNEEIEKSKVILSKVNPQWFEDFYGKPFGSPTVYLGMSNGRSNYALTAHGGEGDYGILLGWTSPSKNYHSHVLRVVIHEFAHNFTNPITSDYYDSMEQSANVVFPYVKDMLIKVAYGTARSMVGEWLNELFVNTYIKENGVFFLMYDIANNEDRGFIWMRRSVEFMDNFNNNRDIYPTIDSFMPQIVSFFNNIGTDIETVWAEYESRHPYVVNTFPVFGSEIGSDIKEIRITFSEDMIDAYGTDTLEGFKFPSIANFHEDVFWDKDDRTIVISLKGLSPNTKYGLSLPFAPYIATTGHRLKEDYKFHFKTK